MTPLPSCLGPALEPARPDANPSLAPTPPDDASPASPFGLAIDQALSGHDEAATEGETPQPESPDATPAAPDASQCPAWACLIQITPAPVPTPPPPKAAHTRGQDTGSAAATPLIPLPAGTSNLPASSVRAAEPALDSPALPALAAALTPKPNPGPAPGAPPAPKAASNRFQTPQPESPLPFRQAADAGLAASPENDVLPSPIPLTPLTVAETTAAIPKSRPDLIPSPLAEVLPAEDLGPRLLVPKEAAGQDPGSPTPTRLGLEPPPSSGAPPIPAPPAVSTATSPREPASPTAWPEALPAASGPDTAPAPATFTPPPGKNVTSPTGNRPILSPAKDGTNGAQLTGVTMPQAQISTAQAETGRMLPTSGTGTVPAVSSSTASPAGASLDLDLAEASRPESDAFRAEPRMIEAAPERALASFTPAFPADRLAPLDGAADLREAGATAPSPAATLERLEVQLRERVVEFRERRMDTLSVVLRPDAGTELHLQLRLHGQQVEVLAHCPRGDAAGLQSQWHQLQQSLAGQGVRLSGLETGAGDSRRQPAPPPPPSEPAGAFAPSATPRTGQPLPARPTSASRRLLESWA